MGYKRKELFTTDEMAIVQRFLDDLVTVPAAAKKIGISTQHLYLLLRKKDDKKGGKIPKEAIVEIQTVQLLRWSIIKKVKFITYKKNTKTSVENDTTH